MFEVYFRKWAAVVLKARIKTPISSLVSAGRFMSSWPLVIFFAATVKSSRGWVICDVMRIVTAMKINSRRAVKSKMTMTALTRSAYTSDLLSVRTSFIPFRKVSKAMTRVVLPSL